MTCGSATSLRRRFGGRWSVGGVRNIRGVSPLLGGLFLFQTIPFATVPKAANKYDANRINDLFVRSQLIVRLIRR